LLSPVPRFMAAAPRFVDVLLRTGEMPHRLASVPVYYGSSVDPGAARTPVRWRCRHSGPSISPVPAEVPYSGARRRNGRRRSYLQLCAIVTVDSEPLTGQRHRKLPLAKPA
jgi:hypothetical protein